MFKTIGPDSIIVLDGIRVTLIFKFQVNFCISVQEGPKNFLMQQNICNRHIYVQLWSNIWPTGFIFGDKAKKLIFGASQHKILTNIGTLFGLRWLQELFS